MPEEYFIVHFRFAYPRCRTTWCGIRKPPCYTPDSEGKKRAQCRFRKYIECGKNSVIYDDEDEREADAIHETCYEVSRKYYREYPLHCIHFAPYGIDYEPELEFPPGYPPECLQNAITMSGITNVPQRTANDHFPLRCVAVL